MRVDEILKLVTGPAFIAAAVALLRKHYPQVDGKLVLAAAATLSLVVTLLTIYAQNIPGPVWIVLSAIGTAVLASGGTTYLDRLASKVTTVTPAAPVEQPKPAPSTEESASKKE